MYEAKGTHYLLDVYGVKSELLNDMSYQNELLTTAIHKAGATILDIAEYKFDPTGCTLVLLLSESHISVHSYPLEGGIEGCGVAFYDVFTCGSHVDTKAAVNYILEQLQPTDFEIKKIIRGVRGC